MQNLIDKTTSALSRIILFAAACVMAGLGFAALGMLAFFALVGVAVAMLVAPFAALAGEPQDSASPQEAAA